MTFVRLFVLVFISTLLQGKDDGIFDEEKGFETEESYSQKIVARTSVGDQEAHWPRTEEDPEDTGCSPFERPSFLAAYKGRNGDLCKQWLALRNMPQNALSECLVLRSLRPKLGRLRDSDCWSTWTSKHAVAEDFMDRTELCEL